MVWRETEVYKKKSGKTTFSHKLYYLPKKGRIRRDSSSRSRRKDRRPVVVAPK